MWDHRILEEEILLFTPLSPSLKFPPFFPQTKQIKAIMNIQKLPVYCQHVG